MVGRCREAVKLAYDIFKSVSAPNQSPLVVVHGLLGCKRNWRPIARALNSRGFGKVYCVDARNHGSSPWSKDMNYEFLAEDILNFINQLEASDVSLIGHSMGGKAAMVAALMEPSMINRLVVVDIAPNISPNRASTGLFLSLMNHVDTRRMTCAGSVHTLRARLMEEWKEAVPSYHQRAFILDNLVESGGRAVWRVNVKAIHDNLSDIFAFPFSKEDDNITFDGPALFVSGELSPFLKSEQMPYVLHFFPRAKRVEIPGAGHWINADAPRLLIDNLAEFLSLQHFE
ncbi:abhydrolase domain containing protein 11 [Echinococcus multilocularis]|uniref:sn-1-specific diacylglycerol lipase ABHD11 n=1 Tax=Echinococcus multilocularis TaxID=6211 RepID=A0A068YBH7_ECHMU|nr:abhydrolase domain containing protein 11 [Echinococcus multilocularis]